MRQLLSILLLFTALLGGCAHHPATTVESSAQADNIFKTGVLWKISKPGHKPSYLFGTVHSEDPRILAIGEAVSPNLMSADILAVEVLLDNSNSTKASRAMFYRDGDNLRQVAGEKLFQQSVTALKPRGISEQHVLMMKPWAVFTVLSMPEKQSGLFLDAMLYRRAQQAGKKLVGLETMEEQISVFDQMSVEDQLILLRDTLKNADGLEKMVESIIDQYLKRDLELIDQTNNEYMEFTDPEVAKRVNERLLYQRNDRMLQRMLPLLNQGNAFVAVGVLHLAGDQGVLQLLHDQGYQLQSLQ